MIGTIVNAGAIVCGTLIGSVFHKGLKIKYQEALFNAMGFAAMVLGITSVVTNLPNSAYPILFILSMAIGSLVGTIIDIDGRLKKITERSAKTKWVEGVSTGVIIFCMGTLSILGPVMSATKGDHTYLFTNATLDFVTSMVLASRYGIGMILTAPILFVWQGAIYCVAYFLSGSFFSDELMTELSIIGGVLIMISGLNILKIKDGKALNVLPALFVPIIFFIFKDFIL